MVKKLENASITVGQNGKDIQSILFVREPKSERGVGMLSHTYDDPARDNETWLYLSALGKIKRMVASSSDDDSEPVSLFGSEFITEDQETGKIDKYEFTLLDKVTYKGQKAYLGGGCRKVRNRTLRDFWPIIFTCEQDMGPSEW